MWDTAFFSQTLKNTYWVFIVLCNWPSHKLTLDSWRRRKATSLSLCFYYCKHGHTERNAFILLGLSYHQINRVHKHLLCLLIGIVSRYISGLLYYNCSDIWGQRIVHFGLGRKTGCLVLHKSDAKLDKHCVCVTTAWETMLLAMH